MKKTLIFSTMLFLIVGCGTFSNFIKDSKSTNPVFYDSQGNGWCHEYDKAMNKKQLLEGMDTQMVEKILGNPLYKRQKTDYLTVWEYQEKSLFFLQDLLIVWKEK